MKTALDALRLILAKEHSFDPRMRYLQPNHDSMVPLLIMFSEYFKYVETSLTQDERREIRLAVMSTIVQRPVESFYTLTSWEISATANFIKELNDEEANKGNRFIEYVASNP